MTTTSTISAATPLASMAQPGLWPSGFHPSLLRFLAQGQLWRAFIITLAMARHIPARTRGGADPAALAALKRPHDGVQQYLTARRGGDTTEVMNEVEAIARQVLDAQSDTVRGIYPQVLADKGLVEAARGLITHSGIDGEGVEDLSTADTPGSLCRLSDTPALLLYHCVAEGLTNAVTHSGASAILATIQRRENHSTHCLR